MTSIFRGFGRRLALVGGLAVVGLMLGVAAAQGGIWKVSSLNPSWGTTTPAVWFDASVPTEVRDAITQGAIQWNNEPGAMNFAFEATTSSTRWRVDSAPPARVVGIMSEAIDGQYSILADARTWVYASDTSTNYSSIVRYDTSEVWASTTASTIPSTHVDRWGVSTHEFGHVTGISHTASGSQYCPSNPGNSTSVMCPSTSYGLTNWRALFPIDKGSFAELYSSPT